MGVPVFLSLLGALSGSSGSKNATIDRSGQNQNQMTSADPMKLVEQQPGSMNPPSLNSSDPTVKDEMIKRYGFENDTRFYGHYLPSHFKKTTIVKTTGRVR